MVCASVLCSDGDKATGGRLSLNSFLVGADLSLCLSFPRPLRNAELQGSLQPPTALNLPKVKGRKTSPRRTGPPPQGRVHPVQGGGRGQALPGTVTQADYLIFPSHSFLSSKTGLRMDCFTDRLDSLGFREITGKIVVFDELHFR